MAFRIENILKKDATVRLPCLDSNENRSLSRDKELKEGINAGKRDDSDSILHRTLSNRLHPPYYCYGSEGYPLDKASANLYTYGCERLCYPQSYYGLYLDNDYQRLYSKGRFYSPCSPTSTVSRSLPTIFPIQYSYYSKRKGGQVRFTANQTDILEKRFCSHKYLSPEDRKILADNLKLSDRQVKTWFQNRRAKWRRSNSSSSTENSMDNNTEQNDILNNLTRK